MILFQIFFCVIIIGSAFFGLPTFLAVLFLSLLFTLGNVFTATLLIIQTSVILSAGIIGLIIATIVSVSRAHEEKKLKSIICNIALVIIAIGIYTYFRRILYYILIIMSVIFIFCKIKKYFIMSDLKNRYKIIVFTIIGVVIIGVIPQFRNLLIYGIIPSNFKDELNIVKKINFKKYNDKYGVVDSNGKVILSPEYSSIVKITKKQAIIEGDNGYGVVNDKGIIVEPKYTSIQNLKDGRFIAENGYSDYIILDSDGNESLKLPYKYIGEFEDGYAIIEHNFKYGMIDDNANIVLKPQFDTIEHAYGANLYEVRKGMKYGLIDKKGNFILQPVYDSIIGFYEGAATIIKGDLYGAIDDKGRILFKPQFGYIGDWKNGKALVMNGNKLGQINNKGEIVEPLTIENKLKYDEYLKKY